jgi:Na+-driven multidrug efflux pump
MGYILYKLTQILALYYQFCYLNNVQILYLSKNYNEMNILYKKSIINSIIIYIISFFPIKWAGVYILQNIYLIRQHPNFVEISLLKVEQYIKIHFWVSLIGYLTNAITQILFYLNNNSFVTYGNILRFLINISFSIFYRKKYGDEYFVRGLSFADAIGEIFVGIYLFIIKYRFINLSQNDFSISSTSFNNFVEVLNLKTVFLF